MGAVLRAVAWDVEGGIARAVFGELVSPEVAVGAALGDPEPKEGCELLDEVGGEWEGSEIGRLDVGGDKGFIHTCSYMLGDRICQMALGRC